MGMYDDLRCHYPLPVAGANARCYQTKDTPCQAINYYEITIDGVLRHQAYDADEGLSGSWISHTEFNDELQFYDHDADGG